MSLLMIDPAALNRSRERVKAGDAQMRGLMQGFKAEVDALLSAPAVSVMDKKLVPPSGDKHDYMSIGPYWWPDPSKPDGLPWIRKDGEVNPMGQNRDVDFATNRGMARGVERLALAYRVTGDERYAVKAGEMLRTWFLDPATAMNPNLNFGQGIPGVNSGRGIGIIDTSVYSVIMDVVELLAGSEGWPEHDNDKLKVWFGLYAQWLVDSPHGQDEINQANNHGTWFDVQMTRFSMFAGRPERARETLSRVVERRVSLIEADGKQPKELGRTRSLDYSCFNLEGLLTLCMVGERLGVNIKDATGSRGGGVRQALDYLVGFVDRSKPWEYRQIPVDSDPWLWLLKVVRLGHFVYGDERYARAIRGVSQEARDRDFSRFYLPCQD